MDTLISNMRFLCDEARMLSGLCVAFGTENAVLHAQHGRAQEVTMDDQHRFVPCARTLMDDSIYDLASLTKLFTAVLTMMLVERGQLSLNEYVSDIDPRFVHLSNVSIFDVLSFRANLQTPGRIDNAPDRAEALRRLFAVTLGELPRIRIYSDINAMVMKYVIEARCGMAFADALAHYIFKPLGMRETFSRVPDDKKTRCVCYNYEHRIQGNRFILRTDTHLGTPHDPKAAFLSEGGRDLCGHAGLFSTRADMVRFAQALLCEELIRHETLLEIGKDRTGFDYGDGTYRQFLGYLCFAKHPDQHFSEVPAWMSDCAMGLSGFTGNHLSIDPIRKRFVLFLGNRCHARVSSIVPHEDKAFADYGLDGRGAGCVSWPDGRSVPSSAKYVYFKDELLHAPIAVLMRQEGWLGSYT